jgi:hypothetical protein
MGFSSNFQTFFGSPDAYSDQNRPPVHHSCPFILAIYFSFLKQIEWLPGGLMAFRTEGSVDGIRIKSANKVF